MSADYSPGTPVFERAPSQVHGLLTGTGYRCRLEGCSGMRLGVKWPEGNLTWPCSKGLTQNADGKSWRIG